VYSLPKHWDFAAKVATGRPAGNVLPHGSFDLSAPAPEQGAAVASLPGWVKSTDALDPVIPEAGLVNSNSLKDKRDGSHVLRLSIRPKREVDSSGKKLPPPGALERAYVAVDSPPVSLTPGTIVRISYWVNIPDPITASADAALVYDDAGGEGLALRMNQTKGWKKFHLYRIIPASGQIAVRFALTGIGTAYFDDVKIEPIVPAAGK
jgi:hypothetical protein